MEKPKRPKKPKKDKSPTPTQILVDRYYPMMHWDYSQDDDGKEIFKILDISEMIWPYYDQDDTEAETQAREDFYDDNYLMSRVSISKIIAFAEEKNIPIGEIHVEAYVPDREYGEYCNLLWERKIPDEEFQTMLAEHQASVTASNQNFEQRLAEYETAKVQYKIDKAAYDVYLAQQKLNSLQENS